MLACIPTRGDAGVEDRVFEHFGSAPYFTLYDSDSEDVTVLSNRNAHHSHGTCHPMVQLARHKIDCVICTGMGRRAIEALNSEGIKIYHADSKEVSAVINQIKEDKLTEMDPARACRGHGQPRGAGAMRLSDVFIEGDTGRGAGFSQGGCRNRRGAGINAGRGRGGAGSRDK